jgi:hypothetical protein
VFVNPSVSVVDGQNVDEYDDVDVDESIWVDMSDIGLDMRNTKSRIGLGPFLLYAAESLRSRIFLMMAWHKWELHPKWVQMTFSSSLVVSYGVFLDCQHGAYSLRPSVEGDDEFYILQNWQDPHAGTRRISRRLMYRQFRQRRWYSKDIFLLNDMLLNLWGAVGRDVMIRLLLFFLYKRAWTRRPSTTQCISETEGYHS